MGLLSRAVGGARRGLSRAGDYIAENPNEVVLAGAAGSMGLLGAGVPLALMGGMASDFERAKQSIEAMPPGPARDRAMELLRTRGPQAVRESMHRGSTL